MLTGSKAIPALSTLTKRSDSAPGGQDTSFYVFPYPRRHTAVISAALTLPLSQRDALGSLIKQQAPVLCGAASPALSAEGSRLWLQRGGFRGGNGSFKESRGRAKGDVKEKTETERGCLHGCSGPPWEGARLPCGAWRAARLRPPAPGTLAQGGAARERPCHPAGGALVAGVWLRCASPGQLPSCRRWRVLSGVSLSDTPNAWACAQGFAFCF